MEFNDTGPKKRFRGYDPKEVDAILKANRAEIGKLKEQVTQFEGELAMLRTKEGSLGETLLIAQRAAEETRAAAREEAEHAVAEAQKQVEEETARGKALLEELRWEIERIRLDKQKFIQSFAGLLEHYLGELAEANRGLTVVEGEGKSAPAPAAEAKPADPIQEIVDSVPDDAANA